MRHRLLAALVVGALAGCSGTAAAPSPAPAVATTGPTAAPVATRRPAPPTEAPHSPIPATVDGIPAMTLSLGNDAAPIDITFAFGSIWVANHHRNTVVRLDPETMATQATIPVGNGPGWFVVTADSVWVSEQLGHGLSRIDPSTNTAEQHIGLYATCGRGLAAFDFVWQPACDAHQLMRIDPSANRSFDISMGNGNSVVLAGETLIVSGDDGLARVDPGTGSLTAIPGPAGWALGFDERYLWIARDSDIARVRLRDGQVASAVAISAAHGLLIEGSRAWVTRDGPELSEVDLGTGKVVRTLTFDPWPASMVEAAGHLWVTNFERSSVIRLDL